VIVKVDRLVFGEQGIESSITECVRVGIMCSENHQVSDVYYTNTEFWNKFAKERSSSNNFKGYFDTDTNEDTGAR